jgi:hypothetical protein
MHRKTEVLRTLDELKLLGVDVSFEQVRIIDEVNRLYKEYEAIETRGISSNLDAFKLGRLFGKIEALTSIYFTLAAGRFETVAEIREAIDLVSEGVRNAAEDEAKPINYQLAAANEKVKCLIKKLRTIRQEKVAPDLARLMEVAEACRKKNGKLNYSEIGRRMNVSYHTAQEWCRKSRIRHLQQE